MFLMLAAGFAASHGGTALADDPQPDATFTIYSEQNTAPGKFTGEGTLTFDGKQHQFSIEGLTAEGVDSNHSVEGSIYGLNSVDDLAGQYKLVKHARESGIDVLYLENEKGVQALARGINNGMALGAQAGGITVSLEK
jgi:hypothetical protein